MQYGIELEIMRPAQEAVRNVRWDVDSRCAVLLDALVLERNDGLRIEWSRGGSLVEPDIRFDLWDDGDDDVDPEVRIRAVRGLVKKIMAIMHERPRGRKERNSWEYQSQLG